MSSQPRPAIESCKPASTTPGVQRRSFLAFKLGREEYGIPLETVQEIHGYRQPRPIANPPALVSGILDLRGAIAPVVDLRRMLRAPQTAHTPHEVPSAVIALRLGEGVIGVVVDSVTGVVDMRPEQLLPVPRSNEGTRAERVIAIGSIDERLLVLFDLAAVLAQVDLGLSADTLH